MTARATDIAARLEESIGSLRADQEREYAELKRECESLRSEAHNRMDELEMIFGRQQGLGGAGVPHDSKRLSAFNAILRERNAGQLSPADFVAYNDALRAYFRHGQAALDKTDIRAVLSVGSDPAGGFTVIDDFNPVPREKLFRTSPMRAVASVVTIAGGAYEGLLEDGDFGFGWVGEHDPRSETDEGTLAKFRIPADELYALVPVTQRLLDDSAIDIETYVTSRLARRFQRGENTAFVNGDGVGKPRGFLDYKSTAVTTADESRDLGVLQYVPTGAAGGFPTVSGSTAHDVGALYDVKAALHAELRSEAVWAMNSSTFAEIEKLKDADGRSLIRQSLDTATPDRLLGYPVVIFEDMPDIAADSFSVAFGNFRAAYQIVEKNGIRLLRDPYTTKGRVKFYAYKRVGGNIVDSTAVKLLKFSAS